MAVTPSNTEPYHLNRVRELYAEGRLSDTQLEPAIEHVLRGGYLDDSLELRSPLLDRVRTRRRFIAARPKCAAEGHILVDISGFHGSEIICQRCDYRTFET